MCCGGGTTPKLPGSVPGIGALPASGPALLTYAPAPPALALTAPVTGPRIPWGWVLLGVLVGMALRRASRR